MAVKIATDVVPATLPTLIDPSPISVIVKVCPPTTGEGLSKLRQINEAGGAAAEPDHDARYRVLDAIADNSIAVGIIERRDIDGATRGVDEVDT